MEPAVFRIIFSWVCLAYSLAAIASFFHMKKGAALFIAVGLALNGISCFLRIFAWWPLLALYQAPYFMVLFFAGICLFKEYQGESERKTYHVLLACLSLLALFFPKDHYVPFLQTRTLFAHIFMIFGAGARACLFAASATAMAWLVSSEKEQHAKIFKKSWHGWIVWGFALFTISMFCGELWSYLGWGAPIVWEDPAVIAGMVVWFYYALHLHLDLLRFFTIRRIAMAAVLGAAITFAFACYPDMGRFCLPTWMP